MADPTCTNCPEEKRIERYSLPKSDGTEVRIVRCIECGNQLVDDEPVESPNMPTVFEETVNGGQKVLRKPRVV